MPSVTTIVFMHLPSGTVPAGRLTMTNEPRASFATFAYGRRYLERPDRVSVDPTQLPLPDPGSQDIVLRTQDGFSNFNGIRDAAPDGWGRYLIHKALDAHEPSEAEILLASGDYRVGALAFGPTPEAPQRFTPWGEGDAPGEHFTLEELASAVERVQSVDELDDNLRRLLTAGSSLGGARPKAATEIVGQPWIAKDQRWLHFAGTRDGWLGSQDYRVALRDPAGAATASEPVERLTSEGGTHATQWNRAGTLCIDRRGDLTTPARAALIGENGQRLRTLDSNPATQREGFVVGRVERLEIPAADHPGGNAIVSFYLRRDLPFAQLNTNKGTGIGTFGMKDAKLIVPGDPYRSVLMYRMSKLGYARMPYIGSRMVDSRGVRLVETWIRSLAPAANAALSAPATPGSPLAKHLESLAAVAATDGSEPVIRDAVQSTEGALALTGLMHAGRLDAGEFAAAVAAGSAAPGDVRGLFETFVPESQRRATLGPSFDPQTVLARTGNLDRGKLIFFSDGARCRNCHELDDRAKSLGPTLREIAKKYPDPAEMMRHVAQPSLKIDDAFAAYTAVTDDGRVLQGLIAEQSDREVVLKTLERQVIRLPRASIEELRRGDKSLMPDRVLSDLTAQEAADLLVYIRSLADSSSK